MKRRTATVALILALLAGLALTGCSSSGTEGTASVQSVAMITGVGNTGVYDRYAGVVVSQQTIDYAKDDTKTVSEIFVSEGDSVTVGQKLFSYNLDDLQLSLDKAKLDLEQLNNNITTYQSQKAQLESDKKSAPESEQLSYSVEIQSVEANISEAQYNAALKQADIAKMEAAVANPNVVSTVNGVVQSINKDGGTDPNTGAALPLMTVMETGNFRIMGYINELAAGSLSEGTTVIIRSRIDDSKTWSGVIEKIDWENPTTGGQNGGVVYSYDSSSKGEDTTSSSKYPFYITINSIDGLMMGQHVYIEPDLGQGASVEGLYLPSYFINDIDSDPWVWAANSHDKLEKRKVELGQYNAELDSHEIVSGLTTEDYIAYPDATLSSGMDVTYYDENSFNGGASDGDVKTNDGTGEEGSSDGVVVGEG